MKKTQKRILKVFRTIWFGARLLVAWGAVFWLPAILVGILFNFGYHFLNADAWKIAPETTKLVICAGFIIGGISALYAEKRYDLLVRLSGGKKFKRRRIKEDVLEFDIKEAHEKWLVITKKSEHWAGQFTELSLHGMSAKNEPILIEFSLARLEIGNADYNPPPTLKKKFRIIGVIKNEVLAWICCRNDGVTVWELNGTERNAVETERVSFPSIYHYLLFVDEYFQDVKTIRQRRRENR